MEKIVNAEKATLKCMSYNLLAFIDKSEVFSQPVTRAPWILETVRRYDPDLLGTQEIGDAGSYNGFFDTHGYLKYHLKDYENYHCDHTVGNSIWWKKERFDTLETGFLEYNEYKQGITWALLYDKVDDKKVLFTNVHLDPRNEDNRIHQITVMMNFWNEKSDDNTVLYATGDYNSLLEQRPHQLLNETHYKATSLMTNECNKPPFIDHIYVNSDKQECHNFYTCMDTFEPYGVEKTGQVKRYWASDHQAVIAYCSNKK